MLNAPHASSCDAVALIVAETIFLGLFILGGMHYLGHL